MIDGSCTNANWYEEIALMLSDCKKRSRKLTLREIKIINDLDAIFARTQHLSAGQQTLLESLWEKATADG